MFKDGIYVLSSFMATIY